MAPKFVFDNEKSCAAARKKLGGHGKRLLKHMMKKLPDVAIIEQNDELLPGGDLRTKRNRWAYEAVEDAGKGRCLREGRMRTLVGCLVFLKRLRPSNGDLEGWVKAEADKIHCIQIKSARSIMRRKLKNRPERTNPETGVVDPSQLETQILEEPTIDMCCSEWNDLVVEFPTGETLQTTSMPLRMSSPVFDAMLTSGFRESKDKRIKVDVASLADFAAFCSMMRPGAWSASNVNEDNVEGLLRISDYYKVDFVKEACEARLLEMPLLPLPRLLQAQRYGLKMLFRHAVTHLAEKGTEAELRQLRISSPDAMLEVALQMRVLLHAKAKQTPRKKLASASPAQPRRSLRLAAKRGP
ncbi:bath-38 [Symbiodinium sp. CCMP2592]|nr:bath-38 [Symbiodinium sp. CCMP2592]